MWVGSSDTNETPSVGWSVLSRKITLVWPRLSWGTGHREQNKAIRVTCLQTPQSLPMPTLEMKQAVKLRKATKKKKSLSSFVWWWIILEKVRKRLHSLWWKQRYTVLKYRTEVHEWSSEEKHLFYTIHIAKYFLHWHEVLLFFTQSYVKSCNLLPMTFFCPWANSHAFSLNSIQISFSRMCMMCKQAETEAVVVLAHYRHARVCKYIHFYIAHIKT